MTASSSAIESLRVVGVAETGSFWKDTRRILHAEAEFDVLGRISRTGLQDELDAGEDDRHVQTRHSFRSQTDSSRLSTSLKNIADEAQRINEPAVALVLGRHEVQFRSGPPSQRHDRRTIVRKRLASLLLDNGTLEGRLVALNSVADAFYAHHVDLERDEDQVGTLRQEAWESAQLLVGLPKDERLAAPH